jgi:hypothetical protein
VILWGLAYGSDFAIATLPSDLQPGWYAARAVVNGIVSASQPLLIQ